MFQTSFRLAEQLRNTCSQSRGRFDHRLDLVSQIENNYYEQDSKGFVVGVALVFLKHTVEDKETKLLLDHMICRLNHQKPSYYSSNMVD
jgi:hypothetical protein